MKKKIILFCFFVVLIFIVLPAGSAININNDQQSVLDEIADTQNENLDSPLFTGYLLIHVLAYIPGAGIHPYLGANISVKGFFYSYSGQTDEGGDCLIKVHTNLFRPKKYFVKVSISPEDWLHTKRIAFFIEPRQILYKEFLFVLLENF